MCVNFTSGTRDINKDRECLPSLTDKSPEGRKKAVRELAESIQLVLPPLDPSLVQTALPTDDEIWAAGWVLVPGFKAQEPMVAKSLLSFRKHIGMQLEKAQTARSNSNELNMAINNIVILHINLVMSFFPSLATLEACLLNMMNKLEVERGVRDVDLPVRGTHFLFNFISSNDNSPPPEMLAQFNTILYLLRWYLRCIQGRNALLKNCPQTLPGLPYASNIPSFPDLAKTLGRVNFCTFLKGIYLPKNWGRVQATHDPLRTHHQSRARWYVDVCLRLERTIETGIQIGLLQLLFTRATIIKIVEDQTVLQRRSNVQNALVKPEDLYGEVMLSIWDTMQLPLEPPVPVQNVQVS